MRFRRFLTGEAHPACRLEQPARAMPPPPRRPAGLSVGTTQGPSWGYFKSQFLTGLSSFGDCSPQNGSKTVTKSQNCPLEYPHEGPFVATFRRTRGRTLGRPPGSMPLSACPPPWRQPRGKSQVNLPQMPPDSGGICMEVDLRNHRFARGLPTIHARLLQGVRFVPTPPFDGG